MTRRRTRGAGGLGALVAGALAAPPADVRALQTATSLEVAAVAAYGALRDLAVVRGNPALVRFVQTTMFQHDEHRQAFQSQTRALGGQPQTAPHPALASVVDQATPTLTTPLDVVTLAETLETVAAHTYLADLAQLEDGASRRLVASVMGVECRHAATLRVFKALLQGAPDLVRFPLGADAARLPPGSLVAGVPEPTEPTTGAVAPDSAALPQ
ncbi:MAG TPA: ferritin-like domain-containing protein [Acidimicrobiales bacterium]|nr:ferritin-like domain-containing protein [Acidimicrobiales bacterium]